MKMEFGEGFTEKEKDFLRDGQILTAKRNADGSICGIMQLMFTYGLIKNLTFDPFNFYEARYCYPNDDIQKVFDAYNAWDGVSEPLDGWVKYKGRQGDMNPTQRKLFLSRHKKIVEDLKC